MEKIRKASREAAAKKVKSLTSADPHQKVDSSTWTPPEALNTEAKTGMRPVSPRAYKRGGKVVGSVDGKSAKKRADRAARKSGGRTMEQPPVDRHINRDLKKANEYRDGIKHVGGMKKGGRIHKDDGGDVIGKMIRQDQIEQGMRGRGLPERVPTPPRGRPAYVEPVYRGPMPTSNPNAGYKKGGRTKKDVGGGTPYDVAMPGIPQGRGKGVLRTTTMPFKKGGKVAAKQMGGMTGAMAPRSANIGQAMAMKKRLMSGMPVDSAMTGLAPHMGRLRKSGGKAGHPDVAEDKALIKKMVKPSAMRKGREDGGKTKSPTPDELRAMYAKNRNVQAPKDDRPTIDMLTTRLGQKRGGSAGEKWIQKAIKKPGALHKQLGVPAGEKIPAKKLASAAEKGGKLGKRARLAQTLRSMHKDGGSVFSGDSKTKIPGVVGGREARKSGGRAKGKTNINIVVSPHSGGQPPAAPMIPGAAMPRVPGIAPAPAPASAMMGAPMGGMPPMAGAPPMGGAGLGAMAGGMPPMARKVGGRVYRSYEDMDAGAGSGEGRLEKTEIQENRR